MIKSRCTNCSETLPIVYVEDNGLKFCSVPCNLKYAGAKSMTVKYPPMATTLNQKIQDHLFECVTCNHAITLNVARVQILMQSLINDYGYYGYMASDSLRLFERTNNVLRKRIARICDK